MPWAPELFSAPVLERWREQHRLQRIEDVPFFDGVLTGEVEALVGSFAAEPELHHPIRGRIRGRSALEAYVADTNAWVTESRVSFEDVERVITGPRGFEELVLEFDGDDGRRVELPLALVGDHLDGPRLDEVRIYYSAWPFAGRLAARLPLLSRDMALHAPDVVGEYLAALAAGDADAVVATFEPGGHAREPAGSHYLHRGADALRAFYAGLFAGGGIPLEVCTVVDDGRACAVEYNVSRGLPPQAGLTVFERGAGGRLTAVRIYDDAAVVVGRDRAS